MALPKFLSTAFSLAAAVLASAQGNYNAQLLRDAYSNLRAESSTVRITLSGSDSRGTGTRFRSELTYNDTASSQQSEVLEFAGSLATPDANLPLVRRIVGDATSMWGYNFGRNAYTATRYGSYNGAQPTSYRDEFFHAFTAAGLGQTTPAARLMSDIYHGDPMYTPLMPGFAQLVALDSPLVPDRPPVWGPTKHNPVVGYQDPVLSGAGYLPVDATPTSQGTHYFAVYEPNIERSVVFQVTQKTLTDPWVLRDVYSAQNFANGVVEWHVHFDTSPTIAQGTFTFVPPKGARALSTRGG